MKFEVLKRAYGVVAVYTTYDMRGEFSAPTTGVGRADDLHPFQRRILPTRPEDQTAERATSSSRSSTKRASPRWPSRASTIKRQVGPGGREGGGVRRCGSHSS